MRARWGGLFIALTACSTKATSDAHVAAPSASSPPVTTVDAAAPAATAAPVVEEAPLAWGTRPDKTGPLYPVVDGMCIHMEVWPFDDGGAYVTYGNLGGGYNRGSVNPTGVRIVDSGLDLTAKSWSPVNPVLLEGRWDGLVVAYSNLPSRVGLGAYSVDAHDANGWKTLAVRDDNEPSGTTPAALFTRPTVFQGHIVYAKLTSAGNDSAWNATLQSSPPLAGLTALNATVYDTDDFTLTASADAIYASYMDPQRNAVLRELRDGKVKSIQPAGRVVATSPHLVLASNDKLFEQIDGKLVEIPLPAGMNAPRTIATAPNGDLWLSTGRTKVVVVRAGADGHHTKVETLPLPLPAVARPPDDKLWVAVAGGDLAGVEFDDIYAIGVGGALFHRENDAWKEITFPKPPWSSNRYRADSIAMKTKGDLFVNASYGEKGLAWKKPERYRAVLRTKRPSETLRCNEPYHGSENGSGAGFMSFPPFADAACKTPFLVIARSFYAGDARDSMKPALTIYGPKADLPSIRASIKATPALGETVELVDLRSGDQGYIGAPVPSVEVGQAFAKELAKRVYDYPELRPELVCGSPPNVVSRRAVNVATGAWVK